MKNLRMSAKRHILSDLRIKFGDFSFLNSNADFSNLASWQIGIEVGPGGGLRCAHFLPSRQPRVSWPHRRTEVRHQGNNRYNIITRTVCNPRGYMRWMPIAHGHQQKGLRGLSSKPFLLVRPAWRIHLEVQVPSSPDRGKC